MAAKKQDRELWVIGALMAILVIGAFVSPTARDVLQTFANPIIEGWPFLLAFAVLLILGVILITRNGSRELELPRCSTCGQILPDNVQAEGALADALPNGRKS